MFSLVSRKFLAMRNIALYSVGNSIPPVFPLIQLFPWHTKHCLAGWLFHETFQKLIGVGLKNKTDEYYIFLNYIGFNFLTVIMCTICCVCMKYGVSKEERHNGDQFFIKSQFHFFKTINTHFNLTQSKWIMGNIFGLKFHLS